MEKFYVYCIHNLEFDMICYLHQFASVQLSITKKYSDFIPLIIITLINKKSDVFKYHLYNDKNVNGYGNDFYVNVQ